MKVEIKEESKGSQVEPAAKAPLSEEKMKEVEAGVLKMLEFYFGDSNFSWDRFMQSKVCIALTIFAACCWFVFRLSFSSAYHVFAPFLLCVLSLLHAQDNGAAMTAMMTAQMDA